MLTHPCHVRISELATNVDDAIERVRGKTVNAVKFAFSSILNGSRLGFFSQDVKPSWVFALGFKTQYTQYCKRTFLLLGF